MLQQIIFALVVLVGFYIAARNYKRIARNIRMGKPEKIEGDEGARWRNVFLIAFGQKKMFKNFLPAVFHLFIYLAFLFTQIELIEIFVDGFSGNHRTFAGKIGGLYPVAINTIEILSILAFLATIIFLARRNILKIGRFRMPEMTTWPVIDANLILVGEILLIIGIFTMNGADAVLQGIDPEHYPETGRLLISDAAGPVILGGIHSDWLVMIERSGWWLHFLVVLGFINYLPFSKHLHIFFAFPNAYYARVTPPGKMTNMPEIQSEVGSMLGLSENGGEAEMTDEIPEFGAKDVFDLSWKVLFDAYTCTECGRCTAQCPANITGKKLSPRKILMDIRDRMEEVSRKLETGSIRYISKDAPENSRELTLGNFDDGKSLFDYITPEELHACTACNACVEACPVLINPLVPINEMRRYEILTQSAGPADWTPMFTSLENTGAVWQMAESRDEWTQKAKNP